MFHGRRGGGRKSYKWQARARAAFGDFFGRRTGGAPQVTCEAPRSTDAADRIIAEEHDDEFE